MILQIKCGSWGVHPKDVGKSVKVVSVGPPTEAGGYTVLVEPLEGEEYYTLQMDMGMGEFGDGGYIGPMTFDMSNKEVQDKLSEWEDSMEGCDEIASTPATSFLKRAIELQEERGKDYDSPEGERSMGKAVEAFNAITGKTLSEAEGWLLLQVLKDVRQWSVKGRYHRDSAEDCVSYAALKAEALSKQL